MGAVRSEIGLPPRMRAHEAGIGVFTLAISRSIDVEITFRGASAVALIGKLSRIFAIIVLRLSAYRSRFQ